MVDVGDKPKTERVAVATARLRMLPATRERILAGKVEKGDVLAAARLAGIMAAKRTPDFVPLCHPIALSGVEVTLTPEEEGLSVRAQVKTVDRTGVEMEALTAACAAALTVYDMCKSVDRGMVLEAVQLEHKAGGRSGTWHRDSQGTGKAPARGGKRGGGQPAASAPPTHGTKRRASTATVPATASRGGKRGGGAEDSGQATASRAGKRGNGAEDSGQAPAARGGRRGGDARNAPAATARGGKRVTRDGDLPGLRVALATVVRGGKRAKRGA